MSTYILKFPRDIYFCITQYNSLAWVIWL